MFATVGVEPAVLGTALAQEVNKVSAPIEEIKAYLLSRQPPKVKKLPESLMQNKRCKHSSNVIPTPLIRR